MAFSHELPWHGEPPPTKMAVKLRRFKTGRSMAMDMSSTFATATALGKARSVSCCTSPSALFSAHSATQLTPMDNSATSSALTPAHRSITSTVPFRRGSQGSWSSSPFPLHLSGFAAVSLAAIDKVVSWSSPIARLTWPLDFGGGGGGGGTCRGGAMSCCTSC